MVSPLYDDISKIWMVLWNQHVCGFILVYVMPGYSHSWCAESWAKDRPSQKLFLSEKIVWFAKLRYLSASFGQRLTVEFSEGIAVALPPSCCENAHFELKREGCPFAKSHDFSAGCRIANFTQFQCNFCLSIPTSLFHYMSQFVWFSITLQYHNHMTISKFQLNVPANMLLFSISSNVSK